MSLGLQSQGGATPREEMPKGGGQTGAEALPPSLACLPASKLCRAAPTDLQAGSDFCHSGCGGRGHRHPARPSLPVSPPAGSASLPGGELELPLSPGERSQKRLRRAPRAQQGEDRLAQAAASRGARQLSQGPGAGAAAGPKPAPERSVGGLLSSRGAAGALQGRRRAERGGRRASAPPRGASLWPSGAAPAGRLRASSVPKASRLRPAASLGGPCHAYRRCGPRGSASGR